MKIRDRYIQLDFINKYRNVLFGIAALLIVYFHMYNLDILGNIEFEPLANFLFFLKRIGNYGVDIFLFLSGIGLYFSMSKNGVKTFYRNRFLKIIPSFILIVSFLNIVILFLGMKDILFPYFGLSFLLEGVKFGWYVHFIIVMYLLYPLIYKYIKKYDIYGLVIGLFLMVIINLGYMFLFWDSYVNIEIALTRLPVFFIGTYFGKLIYSKTKISFNWIIVSFIVQFLVGIVIYMNINVIALRFIVRYLYCFLGISSVINISWLCSLFKNENNFCLKFFAFFGSFSLELYLIHEKVYEILECVNYFVSYLGMYMFGAIVSIVIAYIMNRLINFGIYKFCKIK
jgi:peptidoglycan/LPS O-acetylase OafA/YrhL